VSWGMFIGLGVVLAQAEPITRAAFVSTTAQRWDVFVDDQLACATPCQLPLSPLQFVVLGSHETNPVLLEVGRLPPGDLIVEAKPLQSGMYAGGIVATTMGGMALVTGIALSAVGLARDRGGLTTAGLITGAAGALALPGGIYLMVSALPSVQVTPAAPGVATSLAGTF
jgi:hypothetical protein